MIIPKKSWLCALSLIGAIIMLFYSCTKEEKATVKTSEVVDIRHTTASSGGEVTKDGGAAITSRGVVWSTLQNPTIESNQGKTNDGSGTGKYTSVISGLNAETTYYLRAYAINSAGTSYGNQQEFSTFADDVVFDIDGNHYQTIVIGSQTWFAENLKTTKYNDGTPIPNVMEVSEWTNLTTGAYVWVVDQNFQQYIVYGVLYNGYAVDSKKLCPTGWHVPSDAEWSQLINYIDPNSNPNSAPESTTAGGKLKSTRTEPDFHPRWKSPNEGASDHYGFSALPGGYRSPAPGFPDYIGFGFFCYFWSAAPSENFTPFIRKITQSKASISRSSGNRKSGFSVRCIKD